MQQWKSSSSSGLAIRQVRRQAESALAKLRKDVRALDRELAQLRRGEVLLAQLAGSKLQKRAATGRARKSARGKVPSGRIDWKDVLAQLPKQFKAANVRQVRGLAAKRPSEIFAGITRWIDAGSVKRKARGQYEKRASRA